MYDILKGPMLWAAFLVFVSGIVYQIFRFLSLTRRKEPVFLAITPPAGKPPKKTVSDRISGWLRYLRWTVWYSHKQVMVITSIFHFCLIVTPFFVLAHNILFEHYWGFSIWSFSERAADLFTVTVLLCAAYFLWRRIFVVRVRVITSAYDYLILLITVAPYLTGFLAYHQWLPYRTILFLHILSGELMLASIPFTKLGHMVFLFLYRFLIGTEHSFSRGSRTW